MPHRYVLLSLVGLLLCGCTSMPKIQTVWVSKSSPALDLDSALAQCQQEVTPTMVKVRTEFILEENAQRRECEQAIRQSPEAKATYVDDGFGGLKSLDNDAIAEMCEPSLGERRRRDAEIAERQQIAMVPCMQGMGYDLATSTQR
jgi:hypothetical protein